MCFPRLILLSLLISLCAATAAAQSSADTRPDSSQPSPALTQSAQASLGIKQSQLPFRADGRNLPDATLMIERKDGSIVIFPLDSRMQRILTLEQNEATCYTLRTYRVTRDDPESDTTRPADYSTCQRAARFQLRTAVDSLEIAPR
jgi:hypothetical protein